MTGFDTRFKRELLKMDIDTIVICEDNRNSLSFIGANKLASSVSKNKLWIAQQEYQELGNSIVHRKCL
jgi:actin-related protein